MREAKKQVCNKNSFRHLQVFLSSIPIFIVLSNSVHETGFYASKKLKLCQLKYACGFI